ncbi:MAG: DUF5317 domain-containing protein [Firmicutes bacterium]|nr:DUF5317 domain-containing protein [Bacillota bacterium]
MFLIYAVIIGLLLGWARGGRVKNLELLEIKKGGWAVAALAIQLVIFTPLARGFTSWVVPLHLVSYLMLGVFLFFNIGLKGFKTVALGWAANFTVIAANRGYMPADLDLVSRIASQSVVSSYEAGGTMNNSAVLGESSRLPWLGDIFALPSWVPLANVFSLGDLFIALGCLIIISTGMVKRS